MKKPYDVVIQTADDYIAEQPVEYRKTLGALRQLIKAAVPEAEEGISYQVICYKYRYMLVGIGTTQQFCSLYTMSPGLVKLMKPDLKDVKVSGATIHFPLNEPLPAALIKKIVAARIKENQTRADLKKKKR